MKPKNRLFCIGSQKRKLRFESEEKAKRFIDFNSEMILSANGIAPERAYYCRFCCAWHVTSSSDDFAAMMEDHDEVVMAQLQTYFRKKINVNNPQDQDSNIVVNYKTLKSNINENMNKAESALFSINLDLFNTLSSAIQFDIYELGEYKDVQPGCKADLVRCQSKLDLMVARELIIDCEETDKITDRIHQLESCNDLWDVNDSRLRRAIGEFNSGINACVLLLKRKQKLLSLCEYIDKTLNIDNIDKLKIRIAEEIDDMKPELRGKGFKLYATLVNEVIGERINTFSTRKRTGSSKASGYQDKENNANSGSYGVISTQEKEEYHHTLSILIELLEAGFSYLNNDDVKKCREIVKKIYSKWPIKFDEKIKIIEKNLAVLENELKRRAGENTVRISDI